MASTPKLAIPPPPLGLLQGPVSGNTLHQNSGPGPLGRSLNPPFHPYSHYFDRPSPRICYTGNGEN